MRFRERVEVLWPARRVEGDTEVDDWDQPPARTLFPRATVHPAETSQRDVDADPVLARLDCYLSAGTEISPRCRVRWNGHMYAIAGDVDQWRRYLRVTLVRALGVTSAHRVLAEDVMTAVVALRLPGWASRELDEESAEYTEVPHEPYFTGPCRVRALGGADQPVVGDNTYTVGAYLVTVPVEAAEVAEGHLATVTGSGDPLLDGRELRVDDVVRGSQLVERELICTLTTDT